MAVIEFLQRVFGGSEPASSAEGRGLQDDEVTAQSHSRFYSTDQNALRAYGDRHAQPGWNQATQQFVPQGEQPAA